MKLNFTILILSFLFLGCKKQGQNSGDTNVKAKLGYDHTTPEGILLNHLCLGSNKNLKALNFSYYDESGKLIGTYKQAILTDIYLLFDDQIVVNPTYGAVSTATDGSPINDNTESDIHVDGNISYLYYQPDKTKSPRTSPATIIKIPFTLSSDFKTLTLSFFDYTAGTAVEQNPVTFQPVNIKYSKMAKIYTFVSL